MSDDYIPGTVGYERRLREIADAERDQLQARVAELESGAESAEIISTTAFKAGKADMRERIAAVICPFCNKGVPISGDGRHLGIECLATEVWTVPLDGGDGE